MWDHAGVLTTGANPAENWSWRLRMEDGGLLNGPQQNRLLVSCRYVDELLQDIESVLAGASSKTAFPKYIRDFSPAQRKMVEDYITRIRAQLLRALDSQAMPAPKPRIGALHSILTTLVFVDNTLEEIRPKYMRGYGEVHPDAAADLNGLATELQGLVEKLAAELGQTPSQGLQARLDRLDQTSHETELLRTLEETITTNGLVEFRPILSGILERGEEETYEIAVFGRVSSGKSSLLNHLLETDILPVGVNPITAVPTRLTWGPRARLLVSFASGRSEEHEIARISDFAAEHGNPANVRCVTRLVAELPSARLRQGAVFVDTPGLGSMATAGAEETVAYLPRCDLGIVLIDAGSTLTQEDLATVRALYQAAIPTMMLLSKADLQSEEDCRQLQQYIKDHLLSDLELRLPVHPVSVMREHAASLHEWYQRELEPMLDRHKELARQSLRRKTGALRESVEAALRFRAAVGSKHAPAEVQEAERAETALRKAASGFDDARRACEKIARELGESGGEALNRAAAAVVDAGLDRHSSEADLSARVQGALLTASAMYTQQVQDVLQSLAERLSKALRIANEVLAGSTGQTATSAEALAGMREMPRLDMATLQLDPQATFPFSVGKKMAALRVAASLREQAGERITQGFTSHGRLLESWATRQLSEMRARFDSHADLCRAQLGQMLAE